MATSENTTQAKPASKLNHNNSKNSYSNRPRQCSTLLVDSTSTPNTLVCNYCKSSHTIYKCPSFHKMNPSERLKIAKSNNWCTNCLHSAHRTDSCRSQSTCRICQHKHHTLLHISHPNIKPSTSNEIIQGPAELSPNSSITTVAQVHSLSNRLPCGSGVLLSTAQVEILDTWGNYQPIRVLMDGGSQTNVISKKCLQRLGLRTSTISMSIFGLGQTTSHSSSGVACTIRPLGQAAPSFTIDAVVLPKICSSMPNSIIPSENWTHILNLKLADPQFNIPGDIDMLLGADIFSQILIDGKLAGGEGQPTAMNTVFGWILMGRFKSASHESSINSFITLSDCMLDQTLKKFWEIEELPQIDVSSPDDIQCERSFIETHSRDSSGRFTVSLPFKGSEPLFGDSRKPALHRFYSLEMRLLRDSSLGNAYRDFMRDYLQCGHMELATSPAIPSNKRFYIPHHSVVNIHSTTSPIRVVFDASAKAEDHVSLNDCLLTGPKLQKDIFSLLLQFRLHSVVFTADIKQMYRQININANHRDRCEASNGRC